ncbi:MAG TPA: PVC-type heme-binding CxxCH protein [Tepidisphaeraceae bacterium]|jgi:putative membrane-bound dehydrogenase-like protein|nr:PVC-type heme-binding CxxCH protein [Tepidisphaeraceae bacterium]
MNVSRLFIAIFFAVLIVLPSRADDPTPTPSRRIKVLFLGDNGHHQPLERLRQIHSNFSRRGIDFTYTERLIDLNPTNLNRYDALLVYANIERITPDAEKSILDYVKAGHGYVPIHCASYCFLNSKPLTELTGARFKSHGTGTFKETWAATDHPILKGLAPIQSWDETYVHEMHNDKDRTVLSYRIDGDKKEPYTWTRTADKGRVFYTAWGHDQRTWGNENFLNLLDHGIRWASTPSLETPSLETRRAGLAPPSAPKPFEYAEAEIPNYPAGERWGVTDNKKTRPMQLPLSPQESMKHMVVPPGFEIKLFASEPQIKKPIAMAFDERGRLWVAETIDYPNNMQREGDGHDRITICQDTDNDGVADKFTIFADNLSIPTSLCFANGGLIVTQAPHTLFFKDTDGDDKADVKKILFTGWGTQDTHAGPSNLRYGFDGWIYGTVGYSAFRGTVGGKQVSFGQGLFRFKPDGSALEFLGSSNNNTWGLGISEDNLVFASTANNNPSFHLHIPNRYYEPVRGWSAKGLPPMADTPRFYPITEKVRQVDQHGAYTAGAGHSLYTARSFPPDYWNRIAFVAEPTGHVLGQFVLNPQGANFTSRNDFNVLASDDEWTAPISPEVGPDGALWMIDWYNYIVQHNPIPKGFQKGRGNAYETPLRDKVHGRVYRLIYTGATPSKSHDLSKAGPEELIQVLKSDNLLWRLHAQRLLLERGNDRNIIPALTALITDKSVDSLGLNTAAIHALWTLQQRNSLTPEISKEALKHPSYAVRKAALDTLASTEESVAAILSAKSLEDPHPQVKKSALLALSQMPPSDAAGAAIFSALSRKNIADDKVLNDAAIIAAARHDSAFLRSAFAAYKSEGGANPKIDTRNLIPNPSFEEGADGKPASWRIRNYSGQAAHAWADIAHTGGKSLRITSDTAADSSWFIDVQVIPDTDYKLSAWIKTDNLRLINAGYGALLNVHLTSTRTPAVTGNSDWKKVETTFNSGPASTISINCLFGGYGQSRGAAYFDDLELVPMAASTTLSGATGKAIRIVANHFAQRGPTDSIVSTLSSLKTADPTLAAVILDGLSSGWPADAAPNFSEADITELRSIMTSLPPDLRDRMLLLADRWNRRPMFAAELKEMAQQFRLSLANPKVDADARIESARRLIAIDDTPDSVAAILKQINPSAPPDLQRNLMETLSTSRETTAGKSIIAKWNALTPATQRSALAMILRKSDWTGSLLDAIAAGSINAKDLQPQDWQILTSNRDRDIAQRAKDLEKSAGRAPNPDKQKLLATLQSATETKGDPKLGAQVFEKNCQVCHTLEGKGGAVGPDLTGIGARAKSEILSEIIDPNRSVEGTYRQWIVETREDVLYGRLLSENATAIEIIDAQAQKHTLQRKDIKKLRASDLSVMPEGFEQIAPDELTNLLEFISASKVKH